MQSPPFVVNHHPQPNNRVQELCLQKSKLLLAAALCGQRLAELPSTAVQAAQSALSFAQSATGAQYIQESFPFEFVYFVTLAAQARDHQKLLDAFERSVDHAQRHWDNGHGVYLLWSYTALVSKHLELLSDADAQLRDVAVRAPKHKILVEVQRASTPKELHDIKSKVHDTIRELAHKNQHMQVVIVRQVDFVHQYCQRLHTWMCGKQRGKDGASSRITSTGSDVAVVKSTEWAILRLIWLRALGLGFRQHDVLQLDPTFAQHAEQVWRWSPVLVAGVWASFASGLGASDIPRLTIPGQAIRLAVLSNTTTTSTTGSPVEGASFLAQVPSSSLLRTNPVEYRIALLEACVKMLCGWEAQCLSGSGQLDFSMEQLVELYRMLHRTADEIRCVAIIASRSAKMYGVAHTKTVRALRAVDAVRNKVHAPLFQPSWGVVPLLSTVTLTCETSNAAMYFSLASSPSDDVGIGGSVQYTVPIRLDQLGKVTIRAFSTADGRRSGTVSAQFTVVPA